jgi:Tol biopolymer transport system component
MKISKAHLMNQHVKSVVVAALILTTSFTLTASLSEAQGAPPPVTLVPAKDFEDLGSGGMQGADYLVNLKTGKVRLVGVNGERLSSVEVSPDGKWLLGIMVRNKGEDKLIYVQGVAGGSPKLMGKFLDVGGYYWESDSKNLVVYYDGDNKPPYRYKRKRFNISRPRQAQTLSVVPTYDRSFSPDRMYYVASVPNDKQVLVVKRVRDGKEVHRLKGNFLHWSPNSKRVVFRRSIAEGRYQDCSWNLAGKGVRVLSNLTDNETRAYSPDEKWLLEIKDYHALYLSRIDGRDRMKIADSGGGDAIFTVTWLRDGHHILVNVGHGE